MIIYVFSTAVHTCQAFILPALICTMARLDTNPTFVHQDQQSELAVEHQEDQRLPMWESGSLARQDAIALRTCPRLMKGSYVTENKARFTRWNKASFAGRSSQEYCGPALAAVAELWILALICMQQVPWWKSLRSLNRLWLPSERNYIMKSGISCGTTDATNDSHKDRQAFETSVLEVL